MAEALTDRPHPPQRFYCHICSVEIQLDNSDFICPLCSGGFIEELPAPPSDASSEDVEMSEPNAMDDLDMIRNELATLLMSRTAGTRPPDSDLADDEGQQGQGAGRGGGGVGRPQRIHRRRHRVQPIDRFDNILLEILQTLSVGNETALGNASMFFMGNPGDYAWGREGIDTIVTQLLNQMDTTGPPPLPKDKIDEIPNVEITQEQVDHKLQCSVCWEDFKLSESVRKLPCLHVYHENCIVRWLELHGTCPICRKSLTPEGPDVTNSLRNVATAFIRTASDDQTANTSSSSIMSSNSMQTNDPASTSSQQQDMEQLTASETLFNAIPLSLSRILSTPGTSSQQIQQQPSSSLSRPPNSIISAISQPIIIQQNQGVGGGGGGGGGGFHPQQFHQQQPQQQQRSDANSDRGGAGGSGSSSGNGDGAHNTTNSNSSSSNRTDQHDYKYDDEFD